MKRTTEQNALILHAMLININWNEPARSFSSPKQIHIKNMIKAGILFDYKVSSGNYWYTDDDPEENFGINGVYMRPRPIDETHN